MPNFELVVHETNQNEENWEESLVFLGGFPAKAGTTNSKAVEE